MIGQWWRETWRMMRIGAFWLIGFLAILLIFLISAGTSLLSSLIPRANFLFQLFNFFASPAIGAWFIASMARGVSIALRRPDRRVSFLETQRDLLYPWLRVAVYQFALNLVLIAISLIFGLSIAVGLFNLALDPQASSASGTLSVLLLFFFCIGLPVGWLLGLVLSVIQTGLAVEYPAPLGETFSRIGRVLTKGFSSLLGIWIAQTGFFILVGIFFSCLFFPLLMAFGSLIEQNEDAAAIAALGIFIGWLCLLIPLSLAFMVFLGTSSSTMYLVVRDRVLGLPGPDVSSYTPPTSGPVPGAGPTGMTPPGSLPPTVPPSPPGEPTPPSYGFPPTVPPSDDAWTPAPDNDSR
ncbi:MAG: hypothetical protein GXO36_02425 [Chloroflexi bacterium]|nr:hypothetical protein [Chloroflexota bacterium]